MADNNSELTAQQGIEIVKSYAEPGGATEEQEVAGAIFDQDEVWAFMEWLMGPEGRALAQQKAEAAGE